MARGIVVIGSLKAAAKLARFDASGLQDLGHTATDAWRSFYAAVIVAPMFMFWVGLHGTRAPEGASLAFVVPFEILVYIGGWFLYPVIMWHVTGLLDRRERFAHFVTVYNWVAAIQNLLFFTLILVLGAAGASDGATSFFSFLMLMYVFAIGWFAAKGALAIAGGTAVTLVILDFITSLVWEQFTGALVR